MALAFKHTELDNGLTVVGEVNPDAHTAAAGFFVNVGTRDEPAELMGVSHFLEHMMFKGTANRTADEVNRDFDRIGADYNAFTHQENTAYFAHVLPEHLGAAIEILADILQPTLRAEDFEMERNVILEEIGMYRDRPFWTAFERALELHFAGHPLGYRVLGTEQTIRSMKRDAMEQYFRQRYSPDNIVLSVSGAVDFDAVVEQVGRQCGGWAPTGVQRSPGVFDPGAGDETERDGKLTNHYLVAISDAPSRQDERRYAAAVLASLLGDDEGSRLYWKLVDPGLADEAELSHQPFDGCGTFIAFVACPPGSASEVEAGLAEVLAGAGGRFEPGEVERARTKIAMDLTLQNERPAGRMLAIGTDWVYNRHYRSLDEQIERVMAVDAEALGELVESCPFDQRTMVRVTSAE